MIEYFTDTPEGQQVITDSVRNGHRVPVALPRKKADGKLYVIPSWCSMSPNEHMCERGCWSIYFGEVAKKGRNNCEACEFSTQMIRGGMVVPNDGAAAAQLRV